MSEIYFQRTNVAQLPWVVEHEIGHALGWHHVRIRDHIMHPHYDSIGESAEGMSYIDYEAAVTSK